MISNSYNVLFAVHPLQHTKLCIWKYPLLGYWGNQVLIKILSFYDGRKQTTSSLSNMFPPDVLSGLFIITEELIMGAILWDTVFCKRNKPEITTN